MRNLLPFLLLAPLALGQSAGPSNDNDHGMSADWYALGFAHSVTAHPGGASVPYFRALTVQMLRWSFAIEAQGDETIGTLPSDAPFMVGATSDTGDPVMETKWRTLDGLIHRVVTPRKGSESSKNQSIRHERAVQARLSVQESPVDPTYQGAEWNPDYVPVRLRLRNGLHATVPATRLLRLAA